MRLSNMVGKFVLSLALLSLPAVSNAEPKGWIGALGGLSVPNQSDSTSRLMFGITGGAKLGTEFGVGGYFLSASKDEGGSLGTFTYEMYGVEFAYHFEGEANGVYVGGRLGTSKVKAGGISASPLNYGAVAGYNHFLGENFSLGGEVNFFSIPTENNVRGFTMLNFLGSAKFWF